MEDTDRPGRLTYLHVNFWPTAGSDGFEGIFHKAEADIGVQRSLDLRVVNIDVFINWSFFMGAWIWGSWIWTCLSSDDSFHFCHQYDTVTAIVDMRDDRFRSICWHSTSLTFRIKGLTRNTYKYVYIYSLAAGVPLSLPRFLHYRPLWFHQTLSPPGASVRASCHHPSLTSWPMPW